MPLVLVLAALAILAVAAAVAMGHGDRLGVASLDRVDGGPPAGPLQAEDVGRIRFNLAVRGYRMDEVDEVLDRLAAELAERDALIDELTAEPADPVMDPGEGYEPRR